MTPVNVHKFDIALLDLVFYSFTFFSDGNILTSFLVFLAFVFVWSTHLILITKTDPCSCFNPFENWKLEPVTQKKL